MDICRKHLLEMFTGGLLPSRQGLSCETLTLGVVQLPYSRDVISSANRGWHSMRGDLKIWTVTARALGLSIVVIWTSNCQPAKHNSDGLSTASDCLYNMKQFSIGIALYSNDNDDHLPLAHNWCTFVMSKGYAKFSPESKVPSFSCPEISHARVGGIGYAYNSRLHGVTIMSLYDPSTEPMVYDSTSLATNSSDPVTSMPPSGRHHGVNNILFVDGASVPTRMPLPPINR